VGSLGRISASSLVVNGLLAKQETERAALRVGAGIACRTRFVLIAQDAIIELETAPHAAGALARLGAHLRRRRLSRRHAHGKALA
jgi:hypothetical protein